MTKKSAKGAIWPGGKPKTSATKPADVLVSAPYREIFRGDVELSEITTLANHRKHFNEARLKELVGSVQKVGVLEPVLLRPHVGGNSEATGSKYFLVAGHRRLQASRAAGLTAIPARVLELTAEQAAEVQALENLHREDLGPIEEALSFKVLLDAGKYDVKSLAERMSKSEKYVYRALSLLQLPEEAKEAIERGELTPSHGHVILSAGQKHHEALLKFALLNHATARDLRAEVERTVEKPLDKAFFDPKDGAEPCTACPYNSGNQGMLFDGAQKGSCLNPVCYSKKNKAAIQEFAEAAGKVKYKGIPFYVGTANQGERFIAGHEIVGETSQIKKLVKSSPESFGYGVLKPNPYDNDRNLKSVLVCVKPEILPKSDKQPESQEDRAEPPSEKEMFISDKVYHAMQEAIREALKDAKEKDLVSYYRACESYEVENYCRNHNIKQEKLTPMDCLRIGVELSIEHDESGMSDAEILAVLGADSKSIVKSIRQKANDEWAQAEAAKTSQKPSEKKGGENA